MKNSIILEPSGGGGGTHVYLLIIFHFVFFVSYKIWVKLSRRASPLTGSASVDEICCQNLSLVSQPSCPSDATVFENIASTVEVQIRMRSHGLI